MLRRCVPVIRRMRFLAYDVPRDMHPEWSIGLNHCAHQRWIGVSVRRNMRCYNWVWRLCK